MVAGGDTETFLQVQAAFDLLMSVNKGREI
jgi:hypothetical protein